MKQWYDKLSADGCLSRKRELWEQWSSDLAVSRTFDVSTEETVLIGCTSDVVRSGRGSNSVA